MKIEEEICASVISAVKQLYGQDVPAKMVSLQKTKREFEGNLTLVVFPFTKMSHKKPEETAEEIGKYLVENDKNIAAFNVIKGFLNLSISTAAWIDLLNTINADEKYGEKSAYVIPETSEYGTVQKKVLVKVLKNIYGRKPELSA